MRAHLQRQNDLLPGVAGRAGSRIVESRHTIPIKAALQNGDRPRQLAQDPSSSSSAARGSLPVALRGSASTRRSGRVEQRGTKRSSERCYRSAA
jgi:hypothetical protein